MDAEKLSLLVADDHQMILDMLSMHVDTLPDVELTTASDFQGALDCIDEHGPFDVILLDYNMPGMNGLEGLVTAKKLNAGKPVSIWTGFPTPRLINEVLEKGGAGIILKSSSLRSLTNTIRFVAAGEVYFPMHLLEAKNAALEALETPLSDREYAVLCQLADGLSNREVGENLDLAQPTIKMHVQSICKKLGAHNRTQAVVNARNMGLI
ncbi:response regulator transcription factor [Thioclava sp. JE_KL1]|uniref:response regulator transcription factor n=1 Tax=Thioclava sp. JE_KL1 TaxID=2651187 RepID=UPI0020A298C0|nr:response regulator transcription factor [Thioclava sp. JE_KL1]